MKLRSQRFGTEPFPMDYEVVEHTTLNKTELSGNANKFYVAELHKAGNKYRVYSRYGRVGRGGVEEERIPPQDDYSARSAYDTLVKEKTSGRKGYRKVDVALTSMGSEKARGKMLSEDVKNVKIKEAVKKKTTTSIPDQSIAKLVERIYRDAGQAAQNNLSASAQASDHNPLGVLTTRQLDEGRRILQDIQTLLTNAPSLIGGRDGQLIRLTNDFYSTIPQRIPIRMDDRIGALILNTSDRIDEKEDMIKLLEDVEVMKDGFETDDLDEKYRELQCDFSCVDTDVFERIKDFVEKTQSDYHRSLGSIKVKNVWKIGVEAQKQHTKTLEKIGNVQPLFHGSGDQNIAGIVKRGLLMRPKGVYVTGSMFGNSIYFASQSSKSAQYSWGRFSGGSHRGTHFLFVANVALGKIKKYKDAQPHLQSPPRGYHSVQGEKGRSLLHDEYMIYDVKQNQLNYLVEFQQ